MESKISRIAVFTSGGDAPGMNAAIRSVVRTATHKDLHVYGITAGYEGMIKGDIRRLERGDVANIIHRGGTILKTARSKEFMTPEGRAKAADALSAHNIDGLIAIGGNGTFTGADFLNKEHGIPVVGIPGTIDNDIYGTDFTIGFDTAVNTAVEAVDRIRDTADSHNRLFFIEVMGRHSGYIALYTGIASGSSNIFLPEVSNSVEELVALLKKSAIKNKLFNLVIVAEGNVAGNATQLAEQVGNQLDNYDCKVTIIGHLQRGGAPSGQDRVLASRLGHGAVEALLSGKSNIAMGIINNKLSYTPLSEAISKQKILNKDLLDMSDMLAL